MMVVKESASHALITHCFQTITLLLNWGTFLNVIDAVISSMVYGSFLSNHDSTTTFLHSNKTVEWNQIRLVLIAAQIIISNSINFRL